MIAEMKGILSQYSTFDMVRQKSKATNKIQQTTYNQQIDLLFNAKFVE